jgi:hypothetical protein
MLGSSSGLPCSAGPGELGTLQQSWHYLVLLLLLLPLPAQ